MRQLLDKFVPTHIQEFEHSEERSRARVAVVIFLINACGTAIAFISSLFSNFIPSIPQWLVQLWFAASTAMYFFIIWYFRRTGSFVICGNLFAFFWYMMVTLSVLLLPGPEAPSILLHFTVVPFYLAIIASYYSSIFWVIVFMITPLFLNHFGITQFGPVSMANWLGNGFGILVACYLGHYYRELMSQRLNKQNALLEYTAAHDGLTGIDNRATFESKFDNAINDCEETNSKSTLVYIDLDGFKGINDNYGHQSGDLVLKEVAARLKRLTRDDDTVARLGGDEFALILPGCNPQAAERLLERLADEIEKPMDIMGRSLSVGCSFGCAEYPADGLTFEQLTHHADQRMYKVKRSRAASVGENTPE